MGIITEVSKDLENEQFIPSIWRENLKYLADLIVQSDTPPKNLPKFLPEIDVKSFKISRENIADYPDKVGLLSEVAWESSISLWLDGYWDVLVDLTDIDGERTDLVMQARVKEDGDDYTFELYLVYVP